MANEKYYPTQRNAFPQTNSQATGGAEVNLTKCWDSGSQSLVPSALAPVSPGNVGQMQLLSPLRPT